MDGAKTHHSRQLYTQSLNINVKPLRERQQPAEVSFSPRLCHIDIDPHSVLKAHSYELNRRSSYRCT